jgi:hypothetical protein
VTLWRRGATGFGGSAPVGLPVRGACRASTGGRAASAVRPRVRKRVPLHRKRRCVCFRLRFGGAFRLGGVTEYERGSCPRAGCGLAAVKALWLQNCSHRGVCTLLDCSARLAVRHSQPAGLFSPRVALGQSLGKMVGVRARARGCAWRAGRVAARACSCSVHCCIGVSALAGWWAACGRGGWAGGQLGATPEAGLASSARPGGRLGGEQEDAAAWHGGRLAVAQPFVPPLPPTCTQPLRLRPFRV